MKTGALIIADGHGEAQGDFRPLLPAGDSTVIRRIIITLKQAGAEPLVVVTGRRGDELEKHIAGLGAICLRNEKYENAQMFDGICTGLAYIRNLCGRVFVLPAKFPMFLQATLRRMMETDDPVVCPVQGGRRGHPVLLSASVMDCILDYRGEGGLRGALAQKELEGMIRELEVEDEGIILAVDKREDCAHPLVEEGRISVYPRVELSLGRNEEFFSPFMAQFLSLIDYTGSIQTACRQLHISYTKGWNLIKAAEGQMGFPVLETQSGGAKGGGSRLTPRSRDFVGRYLAMEQALNRDGERLFAEYFPEYAGNDQ